MKTPREIRRLQSNADKEGAALWTFIFLGNDMASDDICTPRTVYATAADAYVNLWREHEAVTVEDLGEPADACPPLGRPVFTDKSEVEIEDDLQDGVYRLFALRVTP